MRAGKGGNDVLVGAPAVEKRQEIAMDLSAEQRVEGFGNQKHLSVADQAEFEMRHKDRHLDKTLVGVGDLLQDSAR